MTRRRGRRMGRRQFWLRAGTAAVVLVLAAGLLVWLTRPRGYRIALDAGHGGDDPGAVGLIAETDLTETTVRCLEALLRADENYSVILCRDYGEGASSGERGRKASRKGADLLLSIHGNSAADPTARGFECYPQLPGRDTHAASLRFARLLGEEMADAGALLRGEEGVRYAVYDSDGQKRILNSADGVAGSTFGVLEQADCPAVLAEQCFLTSAEDVAAFAGEEGCARAAEAYYRAICRYFSTTPQL
ncbi:MAG TPA: N-acetylmuramoyl-L-alanine amidase [Candidatus Pygmaiobacter gallistercoris]|nr:N-acetylmuramoyl-L-alanine amidase [Candidatus Pygmaiobacter gallistercoris]